jgi:HK97 family phage major capsid protein
MKTVKELQGMLNAKQAELAEIFEKAATKVDGQNAYNLTPVQLDDVKARNVELNDLGAQLEDAKSLDAIYQANAQSLRDANRPASQLPFRAKGILDVARSEAKSLGQLFVESDEYKNRRGMKGLEVKMNNFDFLEAKTLMETAAGFAPQAIRTGKLVDYAMRRPMIADLVPQTATDQSAIVYMEETTFTNNAATRLEGGQAGESALAYTERSVAVREIATFLPVTEIQLEDVSQAQALIDNRLMTMLDLTEEVQLLSGDTNAPNLSGFLVVVTQAQAKGADPTPDAIYKGMTKVRATGFAEPSAIVVHPNDWQDIRLLRTTDGVYIWGSPSEAGPERIWGLPAVITTAMTENTAFLGDFQLYSEIFRRRGATIKVSDSHSDYFIKGKLAIRADKRLALAIYRATAFCKVTGI